METTFIYARLEPVADEIRYVGKANNPDKRLAQHLRWAVGKTDHASTWLNSLSAAGMKPRTEVIAEVPVEEWEFWECHYIKHFRECGFDLTNSTPGGDCGPRMVGKEHPLFGLPRSSETRKKIGDAQRGGKRSLESNLKRSVLFSGAGNPNYRKVASIETREKQRLAKLGKRRGPHSLKTREKMSCAQAGRRSPSIGKNLSPEHRAKISVARMGKPWTTEIRVLMTAAHERAKARRRAKQ